MGVRITVIETNMEQAKKMAVQLLKAKCDECGKPMEKKLFLESYQIGDGEIRCFPLDIRMRGLCSECGQKVGFAYINEKEGKRRE